MIGGKVADVVTTKLFRNGGSLAVRIPAGWVSEGEITLSRNPISGDIVITQKSGRMKTLLEKLASEEPVSDAVFEAAITRDRVIEDKSVFEQQASQNVSD
jgi:virulence-associated protein VagC